MPTLQEILAAKKAQQAPASTAAPVPAPAPIQEAAKEVIATTATAEKITLHAEDSKPAPKLSFAEMMAAKRAAQTSSAEAGDSNLSQAPAQTAQVQTEGAVASLVSGAIGIINLEGDKTTIQTTTPSERGSDVSNERRDEALKNATPEDEQAYVMIRSKIDALWGTEDEHLEGAMSDLKKSLMQNPNACLLMYDADLGEMVKNLRRLTKEAQAEAAKEKTSTKKVKAQKMLALTPEMMEKAFDEL